MYKSLHIRGQILAFVVNDIQVPMEGLAERNSFHLPFQDVFFYQHIGEDCHAQSLSYGADNSLGAGTFPYGVYRKMEKSETGIQDFSSGASFFTHKERVPGKLGKGEPSLTGKRVVCGKDGTEMIFHKRNRLDFRMFRLGFDKTQVYSIVQYVLLNDPGEPWSADRNRYRLQWSGKTPVSFWTE